MFGLGAPEIVIILVIILLIFGPKKLPELAKAIGRSINEFKRASSNVKDEIKAEIENKGHDQNYSDRFSENKENEENKKS